jgi:hypothetical protein
MTQLTQIKINLVSIKGNSPASKAYEGAKMARRDELRGDDRGPRQSARLTAPKGRR